VWHRLVLVAKSPANGVRVPTAVRVRTSRKKAVAKHAKAMAASVAVRVARASSAHRAGEMIANPIVVQSARIPLKASSANSVRLAPRDLRSKAANGVKASKVKGEAVPVVVVAADAVAVAVVIAMAKELQRPKGKAPRAKNLQKQDNLLKRACRRVNGLPKIVLRAKTVKAANARMASEAKGAIVPVVDVVAADVAGAVVARAAKATANGVLAKMERLLRRPVLPMQ